MDLSLVLLRVLRDLIGEFAAATGTIVGTIAVSADDFGGVPATDRAD